MSHRHLCRLPLRRCLWLVLLAALPWTLPGAVPAAETPSQPQQPANRVKADLNAVVSHPHIAEVDKTIRELITTLQKIDRNQDQTLKGRWRPHQHELRTKWLPRVKRAARLLRDVPAQTAQLRQILDTYIEAHDMFEDSLRDLVNAVRTLDTGLYERANLQAAVNKKQEGLKLLRELSAQISKGKAPAPVPAPAVDLAKDLATYRDNPKLAKLVKLTRKMCRRFMEIERLDPSKTKTLSKTWLPHAQVLKDELLANTTKAVHLCRAMKPRTSSVLFIHQLLQDSVESYEVAMRQCVQALAKKDTEQFSKGVDSLLSGRKKEALAVAKMTKLRNLLAKKKAAKPQPSATPPPAVARKPFVKLPPLPFDIRVIPYSGALVIMQTDIRFDGNPLPLRLARSFRSTTLISGSLGPGWTHNYEYRARRDAAKGEIIVFGPAHAVSVFRPSPGQDGRFAATAGPEYVLSQGDRLVLVCNAKEKYHFSPAGRLVRIENGYGQSLQLTYAKGRLAKITGPRGQWLALGWNETGLLIHATCSLGSTTHYNYDPHGRLVEVLQDGAPTAAYTYDDKGCLRQARFADKLAWQIVSDGRGRVQKFTGPFGYATAYAYRRTEQLAEFVEQAPNGGRTVHRHWLDGRREETVDPEGGTTVSEREPDTGLLRRVIDPNGNATLYTWDARRRLHTVTDAEGHRTRIQYDGDSLFPSRVERADGNVIEIAYDRNFNITAIRDRFLGMQTIAYDARGRTTQTRDVDGTVTTFAYGEGWLPVSVSDAAGVLARFVFDKRGNPQSVETRYGGKQTIKEHQKQIARLQQASLPVNDFTKAGKRIAAADGMTECVFDTMGNLTLIQYPDGSVLTYAYDRCSRLVQALQQRTPVFSLRYDRAGNLTTKTCADGQSISYTHNRVNQLTAISYPDGRKATYQYDGTGRLRRAQYGEIITTYAYDQQGRLAASELAGLSAPVQYAYAEAPHGGRTKTVKLRDHEVQYAFDQARRLREVRSARFGTFVFTYNPVGQIASVRYPNGVEEVYQVTDPQQQQLEIRAAGKSLRMIRISRTEAGLTGKRQVNGVAETYRYDPRSQLTRVTIGAAAWQYGYDLWGNRGWDRTGNKRTAYTYAEGGRLTQCGAAIYTWDKRGNLRVIKTPAGETTFTYDYEDCLLAIRGPQGQTVSYKYDERGLMVARTTGGKTVYIVYDGLNPIAEFAVADGQPKLLRRYLFGPDTNQLLALADTHNGQQRVLYMHRDERGNVILITDATGREVASYGYDPFGNLIAKTGSFTSPFLFAGHRYEPLFNLYYMRARFYDPAAGRFLSRDRDKGALEDALSTNPYLYVKNSPMNNVDPLGTFTEGIKYWLQKSRDAAVNEGINQGIKIFGSVQTYIPKEKIPWGASKGWITASKNTVGKIPSTKLPTPRSQRMGWRLGQSFNTFMFAWSVKDIHDQVKRGELTPAAGKRKVKAETAGALLGFGLGGAASAAGATAGPVGVVTVVVTGYVVDKAKEAIEEGLAWYDAEKEKERSIRNQKVNDARLVHEKYRQVEEAIAAGNYKEALELKKKTERFTEKRQGKNEYLPSLADQFAFSDKISNMMRAQRRQKEKQAQEREKAAQAYREKIEKWNREREAKLKQEQEAEEQRMKAGPFTVRQIVPPMVSPGQVVEIDIKINGGKPPYRISGPVSAQLNDTLAAYRWQAPKLPGKYPIKLTVTDANNRVAHHTAKVEIVGMAVALKAAKANVRPGEKVTISVHIKGGTAPYTLSGAASGRLSGSRGSFTFVVPAKPGPCTVRVKVAGKNGVQGQGQLRLNVAVQGTFTIAFRGGMSGRFRLTINGTRVSGSHQSWNKYNEGYSGSWIGTYNPKTGRLSGRIQGRYRFTKYDTKAHKDRKFSGSLTGSFKGRVTQNGLRGTWNSSADKAYKGTWKSVPGQP